MVTAALTLAVASMCGAIGAEAGDLQLAEYEGTPAALFQEFFAGATVEASPADAIDSAERGGLDDAVAWLEKESQRMIRACRHAMDDGTAAFPPQVGIGYEAFWLCDYAVRSKKCDERQFEATTRVLTFGVTEILSTCRSATEICLRTSGSIPLAPPTGDVVSAKEESALRR